MTGLYDHGARSRDPKICGWLNIDPLAELYPSVSPYAYCMGNPINLIDPNGMSVNGANDGVGPLLPCPEDYNSPSPQNGEYEFSLLLPEVNVYATIRPSSGYSQATYQRGWKPVVENLGNYGNVYGMVVSRLATAYGKYQDKFLSYYTKGVSSINRTNFGFLRINISSLVTTGKVIQMAAKKAPLVSYAITVGDIIYHKEMKAHHSADIAVTTALTVASAVNPAVGLALTGCYLLADITCQYFTGKSITEKLFD
ncbi:MAG TPA: RHS repeat-associated core domain-containing protein [Paludibacteraceae bacterium]|nr:RHS repeat-associated core domain-containing protein [Paludibacteraceae bacterium]